MVSNLERHGQTFTHVNLPPILKPFSRNTRHVPDVGRGLMLEITLFGRVALRVNTEPVLMPTRKAVALIAYLALEGETSRSQLAALFWADLHPDDARRNLRQELYRISNTQLGLHLELLSETIRLREPFSSDASRFRQAIQSSNPEAALELYSGRLLGEFELRGASPAFNDWLEMIRDDFSTWQAQALEHRAITLEQAGNLIGALEVQLQILRQHEFSEHHHREVMRLQALLGDHLGALRQFERCREILRRELALEPSQETVLLAEQIQATRNNASIPEPGTLEYRLRIHPAKDGQPARIMLETNSLATNRLEQTNILEFADAQALADHLEMLGLLGEGMPDLET